MSVGRALAGVRAGDHVCCTFDSEVEQKALVGRYVSDALALGERVVYVADRTDESTLRAWIYAAGFDARRHLASGQIEIQHVDDVYGDPASFDPDRQIADFQSEAENARRRGFSGLAVIGEMSWALADLGVWKTVVGYEHAAMRIFSASGARGVCQYDRRLFAPELLEDAYASHPGVVHCHGSSCDIAWYDATISDGEGSARVRLGGELDFAAAHYLAAQLAEHVVDGATDVVVDAGQLRFVDVNGVRALVEVARSLEPPQRLVVANAPALLRRIYELCQFGDVEQLEIRESRPL